MSPIRRAAQSAIRLLAAGFIILSLCLYSSDFYLWLSHKPSRGLGWLVLKAIPFLLGVMLFWKSADIAEKLTQDLE